MNAVTLARQKSDRLRNRCLAFLAAFLGAVVSHHAAADPVGAVLESRSEFSVFANALRQSGLLERLKANGSFVLFAVPNRAMEEEGSRFLLDSVLVARLNEERLLALMSYHTVPGIGALPEELTAPVELRTLASTCLSLSRLRQRLQVGPEAFVTGSISADNGTIYALDRLLWQPWQGGKRCDGESIARWETGKRAALWPDEE